MVIELRIDKYLKLTRIIKRRTVAKEIVDEGLIRINGKQAKPSSEVRIDDLLELRLGTHVLTIRVLNLAETPRKNESSALYEVIKDEVITSTDRA